MKRLLLLSLLAIAALSPFSLSGMEKEEPIRIREEMFGSADSAEDRNADIVMSDLMNRRPISEITHLLNTTLNININSHVLVYRGFDGPQIYTILRLALERCNPNNKEDATLIKLILEKGAILKQQSPWTHYHTGWIPYLLYAIRQATKHDNNLSIVKLLVDSGANVNFRFTNQKGWGESALHEALKHYNGNTKCIDYLLEKGADVNACNASGHTSLENLVHLIEKPKSNLKSFELVIEKLLDHGADINKKSKHFRYNNEINSYDLLKPFIPNLDDIIKKVEDKKKHTIAFDFAKAAENNLKTNQSIIINGRKFKDGREFKNEQEFKLNEAILSTRCPSLCLELNPANPYPLRFVLKIEELPEAQRAELIPAIAPQKALIIPAANEYVFYKDGKNALAKRAVKKAASNAASRIEKAVKETEKSLAAVKESYKPLLHAPLVRNINAFKQATLNFEETKQEKDKSTEISEID